MNPVKESEITMASVEKFSAGAVRNQLRHNRREIEHSGNPDIDPSRQGQDYVLSPDRGMSDYDYFLQRKSELYCYNRDDVKVKKSKAENKTLFIDASKEFVKVTNNNKLTEDNIAKIVASFVDREDKDYFCRLVPNDEIAVQDYNLSVSTYVEKEDTREVINITELNAEIKRIVTREQVLRDEIDKIIAEIETN